MAQCMRTSWILDPWKSGRMSAKMRSREARLADDQGAESRHHLPWRYNSFGGARPHVSLLELLAHIAGKESMPQETSRRIKGTHDPAELTERPTETIGSSAARAVDDDDDDAKILRY
ncbi:hypothetical protein ASPTUDRAFT_400498 [Aspergillus tubingensis CBS 134.48]|uniref:Uncharacterized protein n=1 Tax=Aspergillus tubingensis (strain CBS 134.48) TaxID=767770 RepID=A0A1L9NFT4_ASPTC|nr:hypothetical protein ASPTUDRAFT_400498 [Aspergillus tubingensis CBS 134.48]